MISPAVWMTETPTRNFKKIHARIKEAPNDWTWDVAAKIEDKI